MLADDLKEQTLAHHQQLEKLLVGKIKAVNTAEDYVKLLQLFYSYFGGLEDLISSYITSEQLADYHNRRKTEALAEDIQILNAVPLAKAGQADLPVVKNVSNAFGALYVIEGSTLGGSMISKMITNRIGLQKGLSFFNSYGDNAMQMWGVFKEVLNKRPVKDEADIIKTANDTFLGFGAWINKMDRSSAMS